MAADLAPGRLQGAFIVTQLAGILKMHSKKTKISFLLIAGWIIFLCGCGPTAEEQRAADQQQCSGFGYQAGTDAFANCMMKLDNQREARAAADRRTAAAQAAAAQQAQAAKEQAEQEARDKVNSQAQSSDSSLSPSSSSNPVDDIQNKIEQGMQKMEGSQ